LSATTERRVLLAILLLAFALFAPTVANGFAMDDTLIVKATLPDGKPDPVIHGLRAPWYYFGQRYWAGTDNTSVLYRPVTILSYALTYNLLAAPFLPAEWEAAPHHLLNVLLHVLAVYLVWRWLKVLGAAPLAALTAAGAFAVCGIHSEAVAGIVGRAELLAMVFGLTAVLAFDRGRLLLAGAAFFMAFSAKESALAWAPFAICHLLAKGWLAQVPTTLGAVWDRHKRALALTIVPAVVLFFALRHFATSDVRAVFTISYEENPLAYAGWLARWLSAIYLLGMALVKCVVPLQLASLYGPGALPVLDSPTHPGFLAALLGLGAWLAVALALRRRAPLLFLSAAAFLGFAFLISNLPFAIGTIFGERLYYQPSLGVCLLPAALLASPRVAGGLRRALVALLVVMGVGHAAVLLTRNGVWRDNETLFLTDSDRLPQSADLQAKAGYVLMDKDPDRALAYFARAVAADPEMPGAWASIARIHERRGDLAQAETNYARALACQHVAASGTQARTIEDLIGVLVARRKYDEAIEFSRKTLLQMPEHYSARLALLDLTHGKVPPDDYRRMIEDAARRYGNDARVQLRHALFAFDAGRRTPADLQLIAKTLSSTFAQLPPGERTATPGLRAQLYLGEIYATLGQKADARQWLQGVLAIRELSADARKRAESLLAKVQ
jgi:tetratricopeptide (TPR) repeat protein